MREVESGSSTGRLRAFISERRRRISSPEVEEIIKRTPYSEIAAMPQPGMPPHKKKSAEIVAHSKKGKITRPTKVLITPEDTVEVHHIDKYPTGPAETKKKLRRDAIIDRARVTRQTSISTIAALDAARNGIELATSKGDWGPKMGLIADGFTLALSAAAARRALKEIHRAERDGRAIDDAVRMKRRAEAAKKRAQQKAETAEKAVTPPETKDHNTRRRGHR